MALMMSFLIVVGLAVTIVLFFWPEVGLLNRWRHFRQNAARVQREDALKHIYKALVNGNGPTLQSVAGTLHLRSDRAAMLLADLEKRGLASFASGAIQLTSAGREAALHIIRAHRLWECYLAEQTGVAEREWHEKAEAFEHRLSPKDADALSKRLGYPSRDPHGDVIPAANGSLTADLGRPLNTLAINETGLITHLEDEPEMIYAQLAAEGLRPGMTVRVLDKTPRSIQFWAEGSPHVLAPLIANNISVVPVPDERFEEAAETLDNLQPGQKARILGLSRACRGAERRRLLDLGFVPGTEVDVEMVSPGGDPTAYRFRGTVFALRRGQAEMIRVAALDTATER